MFYEKSDCNGALHGSHTQYIVSNPGTRSVISMLILCTTHLDIGAVIGLLDLQLLSQLSVSKDITKLGLMLQGMNFTGAYEIL